MTTTGSQTNTTTHSLRSKRKGEAADNASSTARTGENDTPDSEWCGYCGDGDCVCAELRFRRRVPRT